MNIRISWSFQVCLPLTRHFYSIRPSSCQNNFTFKGAFPQPSIGCSFRIFFSWMEKSRQEGIPVSKENKFQEENSAFSHSFQVLDPAPLPPPPTLLFLSTQWIRTRRYFTPFSPLHPSLPHLPRKPKCDTVSARTVKRSTGQRLR